MNVESERTPRKSCLNGLSIIVLKVMSCLFTVTLLTRENCAIFNIRSRSHSQLPVFCLKLPCFPAKPADLSSPFSGSPPELFTQEVWHYYHLGRCSQLHRHEIQCFASGEGSSEAQGDLVHSERWRETTKKWKSKDLENCIYDLMISGACIHMPKPHVI